MKKMLFFALAFAAAGAIFVGCDKDDDKKEENNQQQEHGTTGDLKENTAVHDGTVVELTNRSVELCDGYYYYELSDNANKFVFSYEHKAATLDKEIDLSAVPAANVYYWLDLAIQTEQGNFTLEMEADDGELWMQVNGHRLQENPFAEGSILKSSVKDGVATISIDATLRQGGKAIKLLAKAPVGACSEE